MAPTTDGWHLATADDDAAIAALCHALYDEDPGDRPVPIEHIERTLHAMRDQPWRGRAAVLRVDGVVVGYALLIAFWSNELGGEVCLIDELYVAPVARSRGWGAQLFPRIIDGQLWQPPPVALELETTPDNARARKLYERVGFVGKNLAMRRVSTA